MKRRNYFWLSLIVVSATFSGACASDAKAPVKRPVTTFSGTKRAVRPFARLDAAVTLWQADGSNPHRDLAVRACEAALGKMLDAPIGKLRAKISERGSIDKQNRTMRDACYVFALLHHVTGEKDYARRSAALLGRFAEVIPKWPLYGRDGRPHPQTGPKFYRKWDAQGLWGGWVYHDCKMGLPLAQAYDLIHNSGAMQEAGALKPIEAMLRRHVDISFRYGTAFSNMDGPQIRGILNFAFILGEPEWVHMCVKWIKDIYKVNFYADGWWHEGTPSYHKQIHYALKSISRDLLQGYSDPAYFKKSNIDGTRFDNLDMMETMARPFGRADAVLRDVQQPNGIYQVIHDTCFPQPAPAMKQADPVLFGCMGHAILGTGKGKGNMVQASLHFGGTHGHEHCDCLNIILFAKGKEIMSETRYRPREATNSTPEWHHMTAGHLTVVVDEKDQRHRQTGASPDDRIPVVRKRQPEDAVPGTADGRWRWNGLGNNMNDGKLRLFNHDFEPVQIAEADGIRCYKPVMDQYRRTIALVKISETDVYMVDIFRVTGGKTHDYMLHSCLDFPHKVRLSIPLPKRRPGPIHKYIRNLHSSGTDGDWTATFTLDDGSASLKCFVLAQGGTEVIKGTAPAMRRLGTAPFLAVRQTDGDSLFIAVHHPYVGKPLVQKVERVALEPSDGKTVALRITLPDRVDTIICTTDEAPFVRRRTADGKIALRGRFAHVAQGGPGNTWAYLVAGEELRAGDMTIEGRVSHEGVLTGTRRVDAGDAVDAFETAARLPADGSLNGRTLMVDEGGLMVQSFRIRSVEHRGSVTLLHSLDEPGMTITPGLVKLEHYPCWGIKGKAKFRIAGSALLVRKLDGVWNVSATGPVTASVKGATVKPVFGSAFGSEAQARRAARTGKRDKQSHTGLQGSEGNKNPVR